MTAPKSPGEDEIARQILLRHKLVRFAGQFYIRETDRWLALDRDAEVKFIFGAIRELDFVPTERDQRKVSVALIARCHHVSTVPAWLGTPHPNPVIACNNGLVDIKTRALLPHTDDYFTLNVLPYDYDPEVAEPAELLRFLRSIWGEDPESIASFQEMLGYILTPETWMQVIFQLVGKTRSGKGTIGRLIVGLLGSDNTCSPSLQAITSRFGLMTALGKLVMLISETRTDRLLGKPAMTDMLLRISGEDSIDVDRKGILPWQGRLTTRIVILSNEPLDLPDDASALSGRLIIFHLPRSFLGREDHELDAKLASERGAILKWAIEGFGRVQSHRQRIRQPTTGLPLLEMTRIQASPLAGFIEEACELNPDFTMEKDALYSAYAGYMSFENKHPLSRTAFFTKLYSYDVTSHKGAWVRGSGKKLRQPSVVRGIRLRDHDASNDAEVIPMPLTTSVARTKA